MQREKMSDETVRGRIRNYLIDNIDAFTAPVLEVGSMLPDTGNGPAWWAYSRNLMPEGTEWVGLDFFSGPCVDVVADIEKQTQFPDGYFSLVLCSEVMEHLYDPRAALLEMYRVLAPGGQILITTLFSFPIHGYPSDYWRFTPHCMERLLWDAGFKDVKVQSAGSVDFFLANDAPGACEHKTAPMHVFARATK